MRTLRVGALGGILEPAAGYIEYRYDPNMAHEGALGQCAESRTL